MRIDQFQCLMGILLVCAASFSVRASTGTEPTESAASLDALALAQGALTWPLTRSDQQGLKDLDRAVAWLNSDALTAAGLRGKVVLIDFWTYSCINWRRQYPYVRAWAEKYHDYGLVVIGVHSPEFSFEADIDNVARAVEDIGVSYPVAVDSDHAIWRAFENAYWPALYLVDAKGHLRHHQYGEGNYEQSERAIQSLLAEAVGRSVPRDLVRVLASGAEAAADVDSLKSSENYVGYARERRFASTKAMPEQPFVYDAPRQLSIDQWALAGDWTWQQESAVLNTAGGRVAYAFHARDLHLVMGPNSRDRPVRFRVTLDGLPPGKAHGVDVDERGFGVLSEHRMYQLIRQHGTIVDRRFEIEFLDPLAQVYSFSFG